MSNTSDASNTSAPLTYKDAGVDIDAGNSLVERIKGAAQSTRRPEVLAGLGGFGSLFALPKGYEEPVLVAGTDGVGTKLRLAMQMGDHSTIGIDLVAMCVNDLIVGGAEPLFFLDYYGTGRLNVDIATQVVEGIAEGCRQSGCALVGGETAEMPGMYAGDDYDLAGFCVGIAERSKIVDGSRVQAGDSLIALASSGAHSNGYSLIRKILERADADLTQDLDGRTLGQALLEPTRIYVKPLLELLKQVDVHALCHITGGGFYENIPRILPENAQAHLDLSTWTLPPVFTWLQEQGQVLWPEMYRTFNCGAGMLIAVPSNQTEKALACLKELGEDAWLAGDIRPINSDNDPQVVLEGLPG